MAAITWEFKETQDEANRILTYNKIQRKRPGKIYIVLQLDKQLESKMKQINKLYVVNPDETVSSYMFKIRQRGNLGPENAMIMFVGENHIIPRQNDTLDSISHQHRDKKDGFLYLYISGENTFG